MMRLDKYLAERTGMTRSESRKAITKGRVMVAGKSLPQGGYPAGRDRRADRAGRCAVGRRI